MDWLTQSIDFALARAGDPLFVVEAFYVLLSIVGQEFVSRRDWRGFYAWMASNVFAAWLFCSSERWLALLLSVYFFYKSFVGLRTWRHLERIEREARQGVTRA